MEADGGDVGGQLPLLQIQPESKHDSSVADLGCLSDPNLGFLPIPEPGSRAKKIPDSGSASKNLSI